jgi:hypothetical protein
VGITENGAVFVYHQAALWHFLTVVRGSSTNRCTNLQVNEWRQVFNQVFKDQASKERAHDLLLGETSARSWGKSLGMESRDMLEYLFQHSRKSPCYS